MWLTPEVLSQEIKVQFQFVIGVDKDLVETGPVVQVAVLTRSLYSLHEFSFLYQSLQTFESFFGVSSEVLELHQ